MILSFRNYIKENKESIAFFSVIFLAVFCSIFSFLYYYSNGLTLVNGDTKSHLNIARRVIFSLTPGVTQLGGIWLPLPHILNLITIWNDFMYYSGLSGSIISMISYIIAVLITFKAVYFYTKSLLHAIAASLIMILNPAFLYFQSTPMTESLSIATLMISIYLLMKWAKSNNLATLLLAAVITAIATLSRYDNWILLPSCGMIIILVEFLKHKSRKIAESSLIIFLVLAGFGVFIWLLYNQAIFGSALNFSLGKGSAAYDATIYHAQTKYNFPISLLTYSWAMVDNIGILIFTLFVIGLVFFFIKNKFKAFSLPAYLLLAPIFFNISSLFLGQSVLFVKQLPPFYYFDIRYGMNVLPAAAFFIGVLKVQKKMTNLFFIAIIFLILIVQDYFLFTSPMPFIIESQGQVNTNKIYASWIIEHPAKGLTLISALSSDPLLFDAHIPQDKIIYEGSGKWWKESLKNPEKYTSRIIMTSGARDNVWPVIHNNNSLKKNYHLVFQKNDFYIYDRN